MKNIAKALKFKSDLALTTESRLSIGASSRLELANDRIVIK